ncbi:MAG: DNA-directed RNA polymerase subunit H [archaeon]|nr:DNA-directed RNA polymerase subunit H [archaeon]
MAFNILKHSAVPEHEILSDEEIKEIFADVDYDVSQLPKIKVNDPVSKAIGAEEGQVLKITRQSQTAGIFVTYRLVSGENTQK